MMRPHELVDDSHSFQFKAVIAQRPRVARKRRRVARHADRCFDAAFRQFLHLLFGPGAWRIEHDHVEFIQLDVDDLKKHAAEAKYN